MDPDGRMSALDATWYHQSDLPPVHDLPMRVYRRIAKFPLMINVRPDSPRYSCKRSARRRAQHRPAPRSTHYGPALGGLFRHRQLLTLLAVIILEISKPAQLAATDDGVVEARKEQVLAHKSCDAHHPVWTTQKRTWYTSSAPLPRHWRGTAATRFWHVSIFFCVFTRWTRCKPRRSERH